MNELFVVSAQRSGSNWLHRCLAAHPLIEINGEINPSAVLSILDKVKTGDKLSTSKFVKRGIFDNAARQYVRNLMSHNVDGLNSNSEYLADKTAFCCIVSLRNCSEQFEYIFLLRKYFPASKIILLVRDVRDVVVSFSEWKGQNRGSLLRFSPTALFLFWRHMNNWCKLHKRWINEFSNDNNCFILHYENLKNDFIETIKSIYFFLGLDFDANFLTYLYDNYYRIDSTQYKAENQKRGYGFFRKGIVGEWKDKFRWYHCIITRVFFNKKIKAINKNATINLNNFCTDESNTDI